MTSPRPNSQPASETTDLRDYVRPIWAHKVMILVLVAAVTAGTYWYFNRQPRVYQSQTQVFVGTTDNSSSTAAAGDRSLANQAELLQTPRVAALVAKNIGYRGNPGALLGAIRVVPTTGSDFLQLIGTAGDPNVAAQVANGFAKAFIDARSQDVQTANQQKLRALTTQLNATQDRGLRKAIQAAINQAQLDAITSTGGQATQVSPALPNGIPLSPHPRRNAIFGFALSLLLGIIGAFGLERVNRRIRSADEAERAFDLPVIAMVPHERHIAPTVDNKASVSGKVRETFRFLRSNLELSSGGEQLRTLLVTSAVGGEGKSTVVRNLALVYAEAGLRVAVIEADFRRPSLAATFNANPAPGLANVLVGLESLADVIQQVDTYLPEPAAGELQRASVDVTTAESSGEVFANRRHSNGHRSRAEAEGVLRVITSGPRAPDPPALFSSPNFRSVLDQLAKDNDLVIIDSPPLLPVSDSLPLLSIADGTVLVCRVGKTSVDDAKKTLEFVSRSPNARVMGLVVNDVDGGVVGRYESY
jgi:succinoglycan biosynthesis transport protein ExoP